MIGNEKVQDRSFAAIAFFLHQFKLFRGEQILQFVHKGAVGFHLIGINELLRECFFLFAKGRHANFQEVFIKQLFQPLIGDRICGTIDESPG